MIYAIIIFLFVNLMLGWLVFLAITEDELIWPLVVYGGGCVLAIDLVLISRIFGFTNW